MSIIRGSRIRRNGCPKTSLLIPTIIFVSLTIICNYYYVSPYYMVLLHPALYHMPVMPVIVPNQIDDPPPGHPWHRWDETKIKRDFHHALFNEFDDLASFRNFDQNVQWYIKYDKIIPYVIQNGELLCPQSSYDYIRHNITKGDHWYPERVLPLERTIQEALNFGKHISSLFPNSRAAAAMKIMSSKEGIPLLFYHQDYVECNTEYPIFANSALIDDNRCNTSWTVPEYDMIKLNLMSTKEWLATFDYYRKEYPAFRQKKSVAHWRGADTGILSWQPKWQNITSWRQMPRVRLATLGMEHPKILDVGFYGMMMGGYGQTNFKEYGWIKGKEERTYSMNFKAFIDVDGNSWSSRLGFHLCMNSVVIKLEPTWAQYWFKELVPWVHYVPATFDNLIDTVKYVVDESNDKEMIGIIDNANKWCASKMTKDQLKLDMLWILISYIEEMQKFDAKWDSVWSDQLRRSDYKLVYHSEK